MKKIALLTSGEDTPGMNPCIQGVIQEASNNGLEVLAFRRGYKGLLDNDCFVISLGEMEGVIKHGGTALLSSRCDEFKGLDGQKKGAENLKANGCDGLIVIGGDGTIRGGRVLAEKGISVVCVPCSIENDIFGTDMALGVDTALNNIIRVIDLIHSAATNRERTYIIEVGGKESGYLALISAIATGAEAAILQEVPYNLDKIAARLLERSARESSLSIIVVAEGAASADQIGKQLSKIAGIASKVTVLGHVQKGGSPSLYDRMLGIRLGSAAICQFLKGNPNCMVGIIKGEIDTTPIEMVLKNKRVFDEKLFQLARALGN